MSEIDLERVEKVVHAWGAWLENSMPDVPLKYPSLKVPESELPYPRVVIEYAISVFIAEMEKQGNEQAIESLKAGAVFLENVLPDEEARKENESLVNDPKWLEAVFKKRD